MQAAEKALRAGNVLILFPEGTRSRTGNLGKGKPGVGLLARRAGVPIVPAHIENSRGFLKLPFSRRRLIIKYGSPLSVDWVASFPESKEGFRRMADELMGYIKALGEEGKPDSGAISRPVAEQRPHEKPFA
jgi:1-acyl-sn-glycerol-3-phosphate acyltransferase